MSDPAPNERLEPSRLPHAGRFRPRAAREMADMFDSLPDRYDLLNRMMTLGQDQAWRAAMWRAVPCDARIVLDLCSGNGVSLPGLRRPGRIVLGMDVSLRMLEDALARIDRGGWAPRLAAADAFRLPLKDASLDAVTVAFGVRNLRPRGGALAEIARVLKPGGTLAVLEATAPAPGWFATLHAFHVRHVIPFAGRLSSDPSAYQYLSRSIFEFGAGPEFERDLEEARFEITGRRAFLLGASRLWVARASSPVGQILSAARIGVREERSLASEAALRNAMPGPGGTSEMPQRQYRRESEGRGWAWARLATSAAVLAALIYGLGVFLGAGGDLPLPLWQRRGLLALFLGGIVGFGVRTGILLAGLRRPPVR
ncbi:MAG: ubiquinone/menaquinone biosynthesis methyltransferase [Candidatus Eisenbacteria bacterium]|nr:ubiquinone/menaquinone biosynthesis methyltransferase [Candidatus Eisenbacteria bacterium]